MGQEPRNRLAMKTTRRIRVPMGRLQAGTEHILTPLADRLPAVPEKCLHERILVRLGPLVIGKGSQHRHHADLLEIHLKVTPLLISGPKIETIDQGLGEKTRIEPHAAGIRRFTIDEPRLVPFRRQGWVILDFPDTDAVVLHGDNIRIQPFEPFEEAVADRLPQPIDTDCNDAHRCPWKKFPCIIPMVAQRQNMPAAKGVMIETYQREFIEFAIARKVLRFGDFELKSGRSSPYFFNTGLFQRGSDLARLGQAYAQALTRSNLECDMVFGPAYKGIPLATATATALASYHLLDLPWAFNRKESKGHGEGGDIVGAPLEGRVLIVDDVITAGTAIRESIDRIQAAGATPAGVLVALDREEKGQNERSAIQEVEADFGIPVLRIITLTQILEYLREIPDMHEYAERVAQYREQYGVT